ILTPLPYTPLFRSKVKGRIPRAMAADSLMAEALPRRSAGRPLVDGQGLGAVRGRQAQRALEAAIGGEVQLAADIAAADAQHPGPALAPSLQGDNLVREGSPQHPQVANPPLAPGVAGVGEE